MRTQIYISKSTKDKLDSIKEREIESYEEVITRLLETNDLIFKKVDK
jgi:hypothetical protein